MGLAPSTRVPSHTDVVDAQENQRMTQATADQDEDADGNTAQVANETSRGTWNHGEDPSKDVEESVVEGTHNQASSHGHVRDGTRGTSSEVERKGTMGTSTWASFRRLEDADEEEDEEEEEGWETSAGASKIEANAPKTWWRRLLHWLHSPLQQTHTAAKRMQQSEFALVAILLQQRMIVVTEKDVFASYPSVRHWVNYNTAGAPSGFLGGESERGSSDVPKDNGVSLVEVDDTDMDPSIEEKRNQTYVGRSMASCCGKVPKVPLVTATLNPMSIVSFLWAFVMLFTILVYVAFLLPITLAFSDDLTLTSWLEWLDTAFGILFIIDMYLKFRTGFIVRYRNRVKLVMDARVVAKYYIFSFVFLVDFLSIIPFFLTMVATATEGSVVSNNAFQAFKLFRLLRMFQFLAIISSGSIGLAEERASNFLGPTFLYLLHVLYIFAMLANFFACLFLYTAFDLEDLDNSWLTSVNGKDLTDAVPPRQYLAALYFAVTTITTVGYGDISAQTAIEEGVCIFVQSCGAVMFGYVTASLGVILSTQSDAAQKVQQYRDKVNFVSKWLEASKLPNKLRRKVKSSFQHHFIFQEDLDLIGMTVEVFKELHSGLQTEVAETMVFPTLVDLYPDLADDIALRKLAGSCKPYPTPRGTELCKFGYPVDNVYFIRRGTVELLNEMDECIGQLGAPRALGMLSSCYKSQVKEESPNGQDIYLVTARALVVGDVWYIEKKVLNHVWRLYPELKDEMMLTLRSEIRGNPDLWRLSKDNPILTRMLDPQEQENKGS